MKTLKTLPLLALLSLCISLSSCLTKTEHNLSESDLKYINKIIPLEEDEVIEMFESNNGIYTVKKSGNFITNKRLATYWIDGRNDEISSALYTQIDNLKTTDLTSALTYASFIEVHKNDGITFSEFNVYIASDKIRTKEFFEKAMNNWHQAKSKTSNQKLDKILMLEDETDAVIEISRLLWDKTEEDDDFKKLNKFEKNFLFIMMLDGQVNNGGIDQYLFNGSGEYAHETLKALEEIKAPIMTEILNQAIKVFSSLPIPKKPEERREIMDNLSEEITDKWGELDDQFYESPENLDKLLIEYVKENKDKFER